MKLTDYIQSKRRGKEANQLEREAMNDPFLQDAIDGFDAVQGDHLSVIQELENQIEQKLIKPKRSANYRLWAIGVAASVILMLGIGSLLRYEMQKPETTAFRAPKPVVIPPKDTIKIPKQNVEQHPRAMAQQITKSVARETFETQSEMKVMMSADLNETVAKEELKSNSVIADTRSVKDDAVLQDAETIKPDSSKFMAVQPAATGKMSSPMLASAMGTNRKVSGKVVDAKGEPVIGATVKIKGKSKGVITDTSGEFELPATIGKDKLEASYIGYDRKEILANADSNIIRMNESQLALNEVVVVGYGTRKMTSMTGAVTVRGGSNVNKPFGEKEFRKYYDEHRSQNICVDSVASIQAGFYIDKTGTPTDLSIKKSTCEVLTKEFTRLLKNSPKWTQPNRRVELLLELK